MRAPLPRETALAVAASPRGPYKWRGEILGRNAYFGVTSYGAILGNCLWLVSDEESDAQLVSRLLDELDAQDPQPNAAPRLQLVRTVGPAIDGPSPMHPEMRVESEDVLAELRGMLAKVAADREHTGGHSGNPEAVMQLLRESLGQSA